MLVYQRVISRSSISAMNFRSDSDEGGTLFHSQRQADQQPGFSRQRPESRLHPVAAQERGDQ